jgi:hypothetical protein
MSTHPHGAQFQHQDSKRWYRLHEGVVQGWNAHRGVWDDSGYASGELATGRFIPVVERTPDIDWDRAPSDATHHGLATGHWYKAGPNRHARLWSCYNSAPAWVCASATRNTELDDASRFIPRPTPAISTETFTMSAEQAKELALDKRPMKVVMVRFQRAEGCKEYAYWAPENTKSGDYAVVYASDNIVNGREFPFTVVQVTNDEVIDTSRATKAILGTFNEDFAKHVQARIEHMARVKSRLQQKKKQFEESAFFEMLAKSDPEAAALLDELKSFSL